MPQHVMAICYYLKEIGGIVLEGNLKAIFGRKVKDLTELKEITEAAVKQRQQGQRYCVTKEVFLEDKDFHSFANDFFKDQAWITKETDEKVLVNSEGYTYPRYTAIEIG